MKRAESHWKLWGPDTPVVGMVHLSPLPGSPGFRGSVDEIVDEACREADLLTEGGLSGILVENYGDTPFFPGRVPPVTAASMAVVVRDLVKNTPLPVGVNVLRNDAGTALGVAAATGARFMRVNIHTGAMFTDQGLIEGEAYETLRLRESLGADVSLLADILVKHAVPPHGISLEGAARDTWFRGKADGIVLTGPETGAPPDPGELERVRESLPADAKLWIGSGVVPDDARTLGRLSDGIIVGSALREGGIAGATLSPHRIEGFMRAFREA